MCRQHGKQRQGKRCGQTTRGEDAEAAGRCGRQVEGQQAGDGKHANPGGGARGTEPERQTKKEGKPSDSSRGGTKVRQ